MLQNPPTLEQLALEKLVTTFSHPGTLDAMVANPNALSVFLNTLSLSEITRDSIAVFMPAIPLLLLVLSDATFGEDAAQMLWRVACRARKDILKPIEEANGIAKLTTASTSEIPLVRAYAILILCDLVFLAEVQERIEDRENGGLWTTFAKPFVGPRAFIKAAKGIVLVDFIEPLVGLLSDPRFQADAASALLDVTRRIGSSGVTLMLNAGVVTRLQAQLTSTKDRYFISSAICLLNDISESRDGCTKIRNSGLVPILQQISRQLGPDDWLLQGILNPLLKAISPTSTTWRDWLLGQGSAADHPEALP